MNDVIFSKKSDYWETPDSLFNELDDIYCFTLDVCANENNKKCNNYFSELDNGLIKSWKNNVCFCNPPYSNIKEWVKKADYECRFNNVTTIMLLPARTDTIWFHEFIYGKYDIRFIKGRLHFNNSKNSAPFPSMIVYFRR